MTQVFRKIAAAGLIFALFAAAVPANAAGGIGISPALQEIVVDEGDDRAEFEVVIANNTESAVTFRLSTIDFGALDESGGIAFLGRTGQETYAYSLSSWMQLETEEVSLEPGQTQPVKVSIRNDSSLSPGGHYGAVLVTSPNDGQPSRDSVAVLPGASTLVLLKKTGGESYGLELDSKKTNASLFRMPTSVELKFKNTGNTHVVPRGVTELSGPFGSRVSQGTINEASAFVLPDAERVISVPLRSINQPWLPGRYTLKTQWRYDGQEQTEVLVSHHWFLGRIGVGIIGVTSLLFVLYLFILYRKRPVTRN